MTAIDPPTPRQLAADPDFLSALDKLRELAEAAREEDQIAASRSPEVFASLAARRRFVNTLDPQTVLALLDTLAARDREDALLREALEEIVKSLDAAKPWIDGAQSMAYIHGWRYRGPEGGYGPALEAARTALAAAPPEAAE